MTEGLEAYQNTFQPVQPRNMAAISIAFSELTMHYVNEFIQSLPMSADIDPQRLLIYGACATLMVVQAMLIF